MAVINHSESPFSVHAVHLELLRQGYVADQRTLYAVDLRHFASNGPGIQNEIGMIPFEYCGTDLIDSGIKLAGPTLQRKSASGAARPARTVGRGAEAGRAPILCHCGILV
jgi:hypothetical protein